MAKKNYLVMDHKGKFTGIEVRAESVRGAKSALSRRSSKRGVPLASESYEFILIDEFMRRQKKAAK